MKESEYVQCRVSKGSLKEVAWIQKQLAVKGYTIFLKEEMGLWEVEEVYDKVILSWDELNARGQDYKRTRLASDI